MSAGHTPKGIALVADDDEVTRLMLTETLEQAGLSVIGVNDGRSALNVGMTTTLAIALLDVEMPGLQGYEVCRALRQAPHASTVPIIMITGHDDAASIDRAFDAGATDFIAKPLNWSLMPRRLEYILRNAALLRTLERREAEYSALIQSIPDTVYLFTADGYVRRVWNDPGALAQDTDRASARMPIGEVLPGPIGTRAARSVHLTARDGRQRVDEYTDAHRPDGERSFELRYFRCGLNEVMAIRQDVTDRRQAAQRVRELAYNDALTGLPNRQSLFDTLGAELEEITRGGARHEQLAVIVVQLSGFRRINETFGHVLGDEVIRAVAEQLRSALAPLSARAASSLLARLEGNQFVVCARGAQAAGLADDYAARFCASLKEPVRCRQHEFFLHASAGIAIYPDHGADVHALVKSASTAMFHARSATADGYVRYSDFMGARALEWISLDAELRRALAQDGLSLVYQPKFSVVDDAPVGAEALLRWTHPRFGEIAPGRFIPIAEETGLILELSEWVVRTACRQIGAWQNLGLRVPVAINLSGKDFLHGDPVALVRREVAAAGIDAGSLEIEVTESVLVTDFPRVSAGLAALKALGCRVALDDFGTGYSSLGYLQRLPLDRLKVDRMFVAQVHRGPSNGAIVEAVIALAKRIGLTVTAEGVEEEAQLEWLRAHGCDEVQGFLLARPMPAADLELLIGERVARRRTPRASSA